MGEAAAHTWPGRVAVAVVRSDPPEVIVASDPAVLSRVLAVNVVARTSSHELDDESVEAIRHALLREEWDVAVATWIHATGEVVDAYPDDALWTDELLDLQSASMEIRLSPIFDDASPE